MDSVCVSHRQQGVWAGGWGPRAVQLGSESVQAGLGPLELARACTLGGGLCVTPVRRPAGSAGTEAGKPLTQNTPQSCGCSGPGPSDLIAEGPQGRA